MKRVGLVGGRGYVGEELLRLLLPHPQLKLGFAVSRSQSGMALNDLYAGLPATPLKFVDLSPAQAAAQELDVLLLALGNGEAAAWVAAFDAAQHGARIIDISADYRHDPNWTYGLAELHADAIAASARVANPGCYATAAMLALWPLRDSLQPLPSVFGVSGFSGAGRTPSPRNDPARLADNLIPYALSGHVHEAEVSHQLGLPIRFAPHVAAFFRGLSVTASVTMKQPVTVAQVKDKFVQCFGQCPLIALSDEPPQLVQVRNTAQARIGGWVVDERDGRCVTLVSVIDNLGKGAATQALQNLNLMCGYSPLEGLADG